MRRLIKLLLGGGISVALLALGAEARADEKTQRLDPNRIEKTLTIAKPEPALSIVVLDSIPVAPEPAAPYPDIYFLDVALAELLDNDYSMKYDSAHRLLKLIFPKSYDASTLYGNSSTEARKIYVIVPWVDKTTQEVHELSLVVPDFLPGSTQYRTTHGSMTRLFAALYQVKLPESYRASHTLRMRFSLKLCQKDSKPHCAMSTGYVRSIRAEVISATLYDDTTLAAIETFVRK